MDTGVMAENRRRGKQQRKGGKALGSGDMDFSAWAAMLDEWFDERAQEITPRLATVKSTSGDNKRIKIRFDDEDDGDDTEHTHAGGKKRSGDTVLMFPVGGGGGWIGVGPVMTDDRADRHTIDGDDIEPNSIDMKHIRNNAIKGDHIQSKAIDKVHIKNNSITTDELAGSVLQDYAKKGSVDALRDNVGRQIGDVRAQIQAIKKKQDGGS